MKRGEFLFNDVYETGTVTVTFNSTTVTGSGTTFTSAMVGRQFRVGTGSPIYTIATYTSATSIEIDQAYGGETAAGQDYQIYNAYQTVPSDFGSFVSVIDPLYAWRLWTNIGQDELDAADPQRANIGQPYILSPCSYDTTTTPPTPRMEIWPHVQEQYNLQFLYVALPTDITLSTVSLPRIIPGNALLEMALTKCAQWPGASVEQPNPYFNLNLSLLHQKKADQMVAELERQDDELMMQDVRYVNWGNYEMAPWPYSASFIQSHGI
jgi:hypothetical protein